MYMQISGLISSPILNSEGAKNKMDLYISECLSIQQVSGLIYDLINSERAK